MKRNIGIIGLFVVAISFFSSSCFAAPAPPPVEYDLTNGYYASLDLSNNEQNMEEVESWWIDENSSCEGCEVEEEYRPKRVHGVICSNPPYIIKNNGGVNLTNVTFTYANSLVKSIPVLGVNETFLINESGSFFAEIEINTEQGVYARFYYDSDINYDSNQEILGGTIVIISLLIFAGLLFGIYYIFRSKTKVDRADKFLKIYLGISLIILIPLGFLAYSVRLLGPPGPVFAYIYMFTFVVSIFCIFGIILYLLLKKKK